MEFQRGRESQFFNAHPPDREKFPRGRRNNAIENRESDHILGNVSPAPCGFTNSYLHLLMPTLELPANQGSMMKTHRNVVASWMPRNNDGLSCSRRPFRNQWTTCLSCVVVVVGALPTTFVLNCPALVVALATPPFESFSPVITT